MIQFLTGFVAVPLVFGLIVGLAILSDMKHDSDVYFYLGLCTFVGLSILCGVVFYILTHKVTL